MAFRATSADPDLFDYPTTDTNVPFGSEWTNATFPTPTPTPPSASQTPPFSSTQALSTTNATAVTQSFTTPSDSPSRDDSISDLDFCNMFFARFQNFNREVQRQALDLILGDIKAGLLPYSWGGDRGRQVMVDRHSRGGSSRPPQDSPGANYEIPDSDGQGDGQSGNVGSLVVSQEEQNVHFSVPPPAEPASQSPTCEAFPDTESRPTKRLRMERQGQETPEIPQRSQRTKPTPVCCILVASGGPNEKPKKRYLCPSCGKDFAKAASARSHPSKLKCSGYKKDSNVSQDDPPISNATNDLVASATAPATGNGSVGYVRGRAQAPPRLQATSNVPISKPVQFGQDLQHPFMVSIRGGTPGVQLPSPAESEGRNGGFRFPPTVDTMRKGGHSQPSGGPRLDGPPVGRAAQVMGYDTVAPRATTVPTSHGPRPGAQRPAFVPPVAESSLQLSAQRQQGCEPPQVRLPKQKRTQRSAPDGQASGQLQMHPQRGNAQMYQEHPAAGPSIAGPSIAGPSSIARSSSFPGPSSLSGPSHMAPALVYPTIGNHPNPVGQHPHAAVHHGRPHFNGVPVASRTNRPPPWYLPSPAPSASPQLPSFDESPSYDGPTAHQSMAYRREHD